MSSQSRESRKLWFRDNQAGEGETEEEGRNPKDSFVDLGTDKEEFLWNSKEKNFGDDFGVKFRIKRMENETDRQSYRNGFDSVNKRHDFEQNFLTFQKKESQSENNKIGVQSPECGLMSTEMENEGQLSTQKGKELDFLSGMSTSKLIQNKALNLIYQEETNEETNEEYLKENIDSSNGTKRSNQLENDKSTKNRFLRNSEFKSFGATHGVQKLSEEQIHAVKPTITDKKVIKMGDKSQNHYFRPKSYQKSKLGSILNPSKTTSQFGLRNQTLKRNPLKSKSGFMSYQQNSPLKKEIATKGHEHPSLLRPPQKAYRARRSQAEGSPQQHYLNGAESSYSRPPFYKNRGEMSGSLDRGLKVNQNMKEAKNSRRGYFAGLRHQFETVLQRNLELEQQYDLILKENQELRNFVVDQLMVEFKHLGLKELSDRVHNLEFKLARIQKEAKIHLPPHSPFDQFQGLEASGDKNQLRKTSQKEKLNGNQSFSNFKKDNFFFNFAEQGGWNIAELSGYQAEMMMGAAEGDFEQSNTSNFKLTKIDQSPISSINQHPGSIERLRRRFRGSPVSPKSEMRLRNDKKMEKSQNQQSQTLATFPWPSPKKDTSMEPTHRAGDKMFRKMTQNILKSKFQTHKQNRSSGHLEHPNQGSRNIPWLNQSPNVSSNQPNYKNSRNNFELCYELNSLFFSMLGDINPQNFTIELILNSLKQFLKKIDKMTKFVRAVKKMAYKLTGNTNREKKGSEHPYDTTPSSLNLNNQEIDFEDEKILWKWLKDILNEYYQTTQLGLALIDTKHLNTQTHLTDQNTTLALEKFRLARKLSPEASNKDPRAYYLPRVCESPLKKLRNRNLGGELHQTTKDSSLSIISILDYRKRHGG